MAAPKDADAIEAQESGVAKALRLLTCRRRSPEAEAKSREQKYRALLQRGRSISPKQKQWYDKLCWWANDATTKDGARIFVMAPRGPKGQPEYWIDTWEFVSYCLAQMDEHVASGKKFAVVWVQLNNHRLWPNDWRWLRGALDERYEANLEAIHVVHPSWGTRILRMFLWPIAEESYWDCFQAHERIEFLDSHIDTKKFKLPKDIYEYDKWLDTQAKEMSEKANKQFGSGSFGSSNMMGGSSINEDKMNEQMEHFKKLLEEQEGQGQDKKRD